jgi:acyl-CoA thioesterase FadM
VAAATGTSAYQGLVDSEGLAFPGVTFTVSGTRPLRIGRSSVTFGQGMFAGELCAATAVAVAVLADRRTERSTPLPDELRRRLAEHGGG